MASPLKELALSASMVMSLEDELEALRALRDAVLKCDHYTNPLEPETLKALCQEVEKQNNGGEDYAADGPARLTPLSYRLDQAAWNIRCYEAKKKQVVGDG